MASMVPLTRGSVAGQETHQGNHQQAGVELVGPVVLGERALFRVEALGRDLGVDLLAKGAPLVDGALRAAILHRLDGPVHCHPGHHLGVGEVALGAPDLPDAVVRFAPAVLQEVHQRALQVPRRVAEVVPGQGRLVQRGHHFAIDVQLELARCGIADPDRRGVLVAGQPVDLPLIQPALTAGAVHDLQLRGITGHRPQQPVAPGHGLLVEAAPHQGLERERGIASQQNR